MSPPCTAPKELVAAHGSHGACAGSRRQTTDDIIDDEEATLKRFRRRGSSIALEAANPSHETLVLGPDRVKI